MCTFYIAHLESAGNTTLVQLVLQFKPFSICVLKIAFNFTFFMKFENNEISLLFLIKHHLEELKEGILCFFFVVQIGISGETLALHRGLSTHPTAQDINFSQTPSNRNRAMSSHGNQLSL